MLFEIYDRKTGEVVDTQESDALAFVAYWSSQGNSKDYGYRMVTPKKKPAPKRTRAKQSPPPRKKANPFKD